MIDPILVALIINFLIIIALLLYIAYLHTVQAKERMTLIQAIKAKDLQDLKTNAIIDQPAVEPEKKEPDLVAVDQMDDADFFKLVTNK